MYWGGGSAEGSELLEVGVGTGSSEGESLLDGIFELW